MGQKETSVNCERVILDTNVVISALLFRGELSRLHTLWKKKAFTLIASGEVVEEYLKVLAYPKFNLAEKEIREIFETELLPYIEPVSISWETDAACENPDDVKFLACAEAAKEDVIVSGDSHLLNMKKHKNCPIITAERFLRDFK